MILTVVTTEEGKKVDNKQKQKNWFCEEEMNY